MKQILLIFTFMILIIGCSKEPKFTFSKMPQTRLVKSCFNKLPNWDDEDYKEALNSFINSCKSKKTRDIYGELCVEATLINDGKSFFMKNFQIYKIQNNKSDEKAILTGYYEPTIKGSLIKKKPFIYPVYNTPNDLLNIDLSSAYPELKNYRLRGRIDGNKIIPYYTRKEQENKKLDAKIICYTDSKIDFFFLEVQGSGRVLLDNGDSIYIGYANQNGHKYSSIGKYLVKMGEISQENISLKSIREWFNKYPDRVNEILNHNSSVVYFKEKKHPASGSLGIILTPNRSVAVDKSYISLGSMLFLNATINNKNISRIVMAEDTGGAIKGALRADMFFGTGKKAQQMAGELISPLKLWILLPKGSL